MASHRQYARRGLHRGRPWWQPMAFSAAAAATIATLFTPLAAHAAPPPAAPNAPELPIPAVPDAGSRPIPLGTLVMPGQNTTTATTPTAPTVPMSPVVAEAERRRNEIAALGDQLIKLGQD